MHLLLIKTKFFETFAEEATLLGRKDVGSCCTPAADPQPNALTSHDSRSVKQSAVHEKALNGSFTSCKASVETPERWMSNANRFAVRAALLNEFYSLPEEDIQL